MTTKGREKIENLEANIVILGGGSGLAAAVAAAEKGATGIILLEREGHLGGHSAMAQGFAACESPIQKRENVIVEKDEWFRESMGSAHWAGVDLRIVRAIIDKSGDTVRWFVKKGVDFELKRMSPNPRFLVVHWPYKGKGPEFGLGAELIKVLARDGEDLGVKVLLRASGKKIIRDAKGNITGVVATKGGKEFEISTRSVIIATGGFNGNKELIRKYCPGYYDGMHMRFAAEMHTGDGLLMADEIGAAISDNIAMGIEAPHPDYGVAELGLDPRLTPGTLEYEKRAFSDDTKEPIAGIVKEPNTVWVNKVGRRFISEDTPFMGCGRFIMAQPGKVSYTLFDDQIRQEMEEEGLITGRGWGRGESLQRIALPDLEKKLRTRAEASEDSMVKIANSWEEIAAWIGADAEVLKAEIEEYNSFCDYGRDGIFAKERRYLLPLRRAPYYALRSKPHFAGTQGGIKINEHMEVLDTENNIIPGVYAAGQLASGCGGLGGAMSSGRIAGENAAEYISGVGLRAKKKVKEVSSHDYKRKRKN